LGRPRQDSFDLRTFGRRKSDQADGERSFGYMHFGQGRDKLLVPI
jgi:hypothetical protein